MGKRGFGMRDEVLGKELWDKDKDLASGRLANYARL
jgi:hypothetical protein